MWPCNQGTVIKDINKLAHLYNSIKYTALNPNEVREQQVIDKSKEISIELNQIMVDLIAKESYLVVDLRKTNKTFTVTINPNEITPIFIDRNHAQNTSRGFMPVTSTYGDPKFPQSSIALPSVIQYGIASIRREKESVRRYIRYPG